MSTIRCTSKDAGTLLSNAGGIRGVESGEEGSGAVSQVVAALQGECHGYASRTGTRVNFSPQNVPDDIPEDIALCVYRVAQEAMQNIWKHAESSRVDVILKAANEEIDLVVEDFGKGFDVEAARGKGGLGLISMQERVRLVGGELLLRTKAGDGTLVQLSIPLRRH